jgi:hypothetical protein
VDNLLIFSKKLPKVNIQTLGENSSNLVTLLDARERQVTAYQRKQNKSGPFWSRSFVHKNKNWTKMLWQGSPLKIFE